MRDKLRDSGEIRLASLFVLMWREERLLSKTKERSLGAPHPSCCVKSKLKEEDVEILYLSNVVGLGVISACCSSVTFHRSSPDCSVPWNI